MLNWLSLASDYNKRLYSPVEIRNGNTLVNKINSFKEWEWDGPEPMNLRESKFIGLVDLFTTVDMENAG